MQITSETKDTRYRPSRRQDSIAHLIAIYGFIAHLLGYTYIFRNNLQVPDDSKRKNPLETEIQKAMRNATAVPEYRSP